MPVAIVNQALVHKYFAGENPIGKHIAISGEREPRWLTIVGIASNEKRTTVYQEMAWVDSAVVYRPFAQQLPVNSTALIRSATTGGYVGSEVQKRIRRTDPNIYVSEPETIDHLVAEFLKYPQFRAALMGGFAGIALLLACVGLYGVISQLVIQRTREVGVRMALGAQQAQVMRMFLKEGMLVTGFGLVLGLFLTFIFARSLVSMLYGIAPDDPFTTAVVFLVLISAALLATYLPARRAALVNPVIALRQD